MFNINTEIVHICTFHVYCIVIYKIQFSSSVHRCVVDRMVNETD